MTIYGGIEMIEKIAQMILRKAEVLDADSLKEIVKIVMMEEHLEDSLENGIVFLGRDQAQRQFAISDLEIDFWRGGYYAPNKALYVQYDNLSSFAMHNGKNLNFGFALMSEKRFVNLIMTFLLLHELELANQENKKKEDDLEAEILKECVFPENDNTAVISPSKRLADIHAFIQIIEIVRTAKLPKEILDYFENLLQYKIISPYISVVNHDIGPSIEYFRKYNNDKMVEKLTDIGQSSLDLGFRLAYGLPISSLELGEKRWTQFDSEYYKKVLGAGKPSVKY